MLATGRHAPCSLFVRLVASVALACALCPAASPAAAWADEGAAPARAVEAASELGSITLQMKGYYNGAESTMQGGQIALFRVATVGGDGDFFDVTGGQFATSAAVAGVPGMTKQQLDEQNPTISEALEREVAAAGTEPVQTAGIAEGEARFVGVEQGLYLLVQTKLSEGGRKMNAFLLSVPDERGELNIVGKPKPGEWSGGSGESPEENPEESPAPAGTPGATSRSYPVPAAWNPTSRAGQPSTGELVVMLAPLVIAGLVLMLAGMRAGRRSKNVG